MRKVKFAFLFVLILCLTAAMFVACNPSSDGGNDVPSIPTPEPGQPGQSQETEFVGGTDAWNMFIAAAKASNSDTGSLVTLDYVVNFDYVKDAVTYSYAFKVQANIDLENDAGNQSLLELWERDVNGDLVKMLLGVYYFDSTLVYDCTGLKAGATVVKTDNINATAVVKTLRELLTSPGSDEYKSLAQFLLNDILSAESGIVGMIGGAIPALISTSRITTNPDGSQTIVMPIGLSNILGGVLGGILAPSEDGLIPAEVYDMVQSVLGIDLGLLSTMKDLSVYISADLTADNGSGRELSGVNVGIGFDYDTFGTSLEQDYGIQQGSISLNVGGTGLQWNNGLNEEIDIESYLTSLKAAEGQPESDGGRGLDLAKLDEYSPLTLDLTISLDLALKQLSITPNELIDSFGTLFGLDPKVRESLAAVLDHEINLDGLERTLQLHISAEIDMFNNANTKLLVELTGARAEDVRARIGYSGENEMLFADLSGLLGMGKFYVDGVNLNKLLGGLVEDLVAKAQDAIAGLLTPAETAQYEELVAEIDSQLASGELVRKIAATQSGEPITDTMGLVKAIFNNIVVEMDGNIFNLEKVQIALTQEILDYIWSIAFTGENAGVKIPIDGGVDITYEDVGFGLPKIISLDLDLAAAVGLEQIPTQFASAGVTIALQVGSVADRDHFDAAFAEFAADLSGNEYIRLSSFDAFIDPSTGSLTFSNLDLNEVLANVQTLEIGLQADLDLSAVAGTFANIGYANSNQFLVAVLADFAESFGVDATLKLKAEVTDVQALVGALSGGSIASAIGGLLPSINLYVELAKKDGSAIPLRVWLVDGVVYLNTSEELLGGLSVKADITPFLAASSASEAVSVADEGQTGGGSGSGSTNIPTIPEELVPIIAAADVTLGDLYLDVALGAGLLDILLDLLNVKGVVIEDAVGNPLDLDAAVIIKFNDGLQLAGENTSEGLSVGVTLGIGENFGLDFTLGGINAAINGQSSIPAIDGEFVDIFADPYVYVSLELGLAADIKATNINLTDDAYINFPTGMDIDLALTVEGKLDIASLLAALTGGTLPDGYTNETELAIGLVNRANMQDGEPETLLAAYYADGTIYVDADALIGARVSTKLDIMEMLIGMITHEHADLDGDGICDGCNEAMPAASGQAVSAADEEKPTLDDLYQEDYTTGIFEIMLHVTSKGFTIELAEALTAIVEKALGTDDLGEIDAALSLNWSNLISQAKHDGTATEEYLFKARVEASELGSVEVTLSPFKIGLGREVFDDAEVLPATFDPADYKDIGVLLNENNKLDLAGLNIDSVYAELSGKISLEALAADDDTEWTIGSWIGGFLTVDDGTSGTEGGVSQEIKSLIEKLVLSFVIDKSVSAEIDFSLRALLRFPEVIDTKDPTLASYILSHSDIALEISEGGRTLLALYILADETTGSSDLYIHSDEGGIIGGGIIVPGIDIAGLFATSGDDQNSGSETPAGGETGEQAITTAEGDVTEGGSVSGSGEETDLLGGILAIINSIYMNDEELRVGFGANFLSSLLNMLLADSGVAIDPENFVKLDPAGSFLTLYYGAGEGAQRDIGIDLSIEADPVKIGLSLGDIGVAINDETKTVKGEGFDSVEFKNIFDSDGVVSLSTTLSLELSLGDTADLVNGELPLGDILAAAGAGIALDFGVSIDDDLTLGLDIKLGANIHFSDESATEIALEVLDSNADPDSADALVLAAYIRGDRLYVDMGMLSDKNFYIENTGVVSKITEAVNKLLKTGQQGISNSEAVAATEGEEGEDALTALDIVLEAGEGHIALSVTEAVILAIIDAVANNSGEDSATTEEKPDINAIFAALGLDAEAVVDIDFETPAVNIGVDTKYASLGISIVKPYVTNSVNEEVHGKISDIAARDDFQSYTASSMAKFGLNLSVEYSADATYELVSEDEIGNYDLEDRYIKLDDGSYMQSNDGLYVRRPLSLSEIVDVLLDVPAIADGLAGLGNDPDQATLSKLVNALLASLGIELYLDDPIGDSLDINISGLLDLEKLGLSGILADFTLPEPSALDILSALQAEIEIVFNPEQGSDSGAIAIYLINGYIYIDLAPLGGPRISADLFTLLKDFGVKLFAGFTRDAASGTGEAVIAAEGDGSSGEESSFDVEGLLNTLVRAVVLRNNVGSAIAGGNIFSDGIGVDVLLPANLLGNIVAFATGKDGYVFEDFILDENDSKISLNVGGASGIELVVSARSNAGFDLSVSANAGLVIDVATPQSVLLSAGERGTFVDMTAAVYNVAGLIKPELGLPDADLGSQRVTLSVAGKVNFETDGEGSYDLGSLLQQYIEDIILELKTDAAFNDGVGFRLTLSADLGKLALDVLADSSIKTTDEKIAKFIEGSDLNTIEVALELLDIDITGNITDEVLAGIYISGGNLYLDGTGIFDVVENYSYVPNFLRFVLDAVKLGQSTHQHVDEDGNGVCDGCNEPMPEEGGETTPDEGSGQAFSAAESVTAADGDTTAIRNAMLQLIYSDSAMQIMLTKSIISMVLATLLPDLGSFADIFDKFEVSLGVDIGRYDYVDISEENEVVFAATASADGEYVAVEDAEGGIIGFTLANGSDAQRYDLVPATKASKGQLYYKAKDGNFYKADPLRYNLYETAAYAPAEEDFAGSYVKVKGSEEYLARDRYTFYTLDGDRRVLVTDLARVPANTAVYAYRGNTNAEVELNGDGFVVTYDRKYGYVRETDGGYLRVYRPYTELSEFYLSLGAHIGTMNVGLSLGGITLDFGDTGSLLPDYVREGKTKAPAKHTGTEGANAYTYENGVYTKVETPAADGEYYYDVPLLPFYDSVITVGGAVEIELAITEGNINFGQMLEGLLGDLGDLVVQIPDTSKGYSSAHLRLDFTLVLDMFDLPASEVQIELYNLSSESGAEVRWLAAHYLNEMLYLDLSFFGLPKLSVPMTEISDMLQGLVDDLLTDSIYKDVEVGSSSAEAVTAADEQSPELDSDLSFEEQVASLLVSKRKLTVAVGNALMRYLLSVIVIGDYTLDDFVYEDLQGGLEVTIDLNNGLDIGIGAELMLEGDRYELYTENTTADGARYYIFKEFAGTSAPDGGLFIYDSDTGMYREANQAETRDGLAEGSAITLYQRFEAARNAESSGWVYYTYAAGGDDKWFFDEEKDAYLDSTATGVVKPASATLYTRTETAAAVEDNVFLFIPAVEANANDYDTVLTLDLDVGDIDLYFTETRDFTLDRDELEEFYDFNSLDTVSLSETISLDLLFAGDSPIDLTALLEYLFPDSEYDFDAVIDVVTGDDNSAVSDILRGIDVTVSLEFKLGAFINYLRSLAARYDLSYAEETEDGEEIRVALEALGDDIDLITFINVIRSLIGAKKVPDASGSIYYEDATVDDLLGLEDFLNFANASVEISATSSDGTPVHTLLGVYFTLGDNEGTPVEDYDGNVTLDRYSHYFAADNGLYGYVGAAADKVDGDGYLLISKFAENGIMYNEKEHGRYARDDSFLYPDEKGTVVREHAGLYVDLSYFGQPGVYMNLTELLAFIGGLMDQPLSLSEGEAVTAADPAGDGSTTEGGGFSLPIDLGALLGTDINLELPLLTEQIAAYVRAFLFGIRITSTYVRILVQTDYLNQLLTILLGESPFAEDMVFDQSYVGINVDVNNYLYAQISSASTAQIEFSDTRFAIEESEDGTYYLYTDTMAEESYYQLRSDMTPAEEKAYIDGGGVFYDITPIDVYLNVGGKKVLASEASNTDWVRAETYEDEGDIANKALIGTYKFYVDLDSPDAIYAKENADLDKDGFAELGMGDNIYVVYPSANKKPLIEASIWLWGHNLGLGIEMPVTDAARYTYEKVDKGKGAYVMEENFTYTHDTANAHDGSHYLYYRGHYYKITKNDLKVLDGGVYSSVTGNDAAWTAFQTNPYSGDFYLHVRAVGEGFSAYILINEADVYKMEKYGETFRYVGEGKGNYTRNATTSLVTVPEYRVYADNVIDYTFNADMGDEASYVYDVSAGEYVSVADAREAYTAVAGEGDSFEAYLAENYKTVTNTEGVPVVVIYGADDEITFVYDEEAEGFVSVATAREAYTAVAGEGDRFEAYLATNFRSKDDTAVFYEGEKIVYGDTGELYYINVVIRGSISLSQHVAYFGRGSARTGIRAGERGVCPLRRDQARGA